MHRSKKYRVSYMFLCGVKLLQKKGPYPMVVQPPDLGYWLDGGEVSPSATDVMCQDSVTMATRDSNMSSQQEYKLEMDETAKCYRRHFLGKVNSMLTLLKYNNYLAL